MILDKLISEVLCGYDVVNLGNFCIKICVGDRYFFDLGIVSRFFDVISFDDMKGEIVLRFNDNYMFDIPGLSMILKYSILSRPNRRDEILEKMVSEGVDNYTVSMLLNNNFAVYKKLHPDMKNEEIFRQLRLNIATFMCSEVPESVRPYILKGAKRISRELALVPFHEREHNVEEIKTIIAKFN